MEKTVWKEKDSLLQAKELQDGIGILHWKQRSHVLCKLINRFIKKNIFDSSFIFLKWGQK